MSRSVAPPRPVLVLDLDEVCFPFAQEYSRWRGHVGLVGFDPTRLHTYNFALATGTDPQQELEEATAFLSDPETLTRPPLPGARSGLALLARSADLVLATARFTSQAEPTRAWVERWLPDLVADIVHTRTTLGEIPQLKSDIAASLGALVLVDDQPAHLLNLDDSCTGVLFGSYPWQHSPLLDPTAPAEVGPGLPDLPELVLAIDAPVVEPDVLDAGVLRAPSWSALTTLCTTGSLGALLSPRRRH